MIGHELVFLISKNVYFNISLKETNKNVFKNNTKIHIQLSILQQEKNNSFFTYYRKIKLKITFWKIIALIQLL